MKFFPFVCRFVFMGVIVPILLSGLWLLVNSASIHNITFEIVLEKITLLLWPSSISLLGGAGFSSHALSIKLQLLSIVVNAILYGVLGLLAWYGVMKSRIFLLLPIVTVGAIWSWLLML